MKYETPNIRIVLNDNVHTTFGLGTSDNEGTIDKGFPGLSPGDEL